MKNLLWFILIYSSVTFGQKDTIPFKYEAFFELNGGYGYHQFSATFPYDHGNFKSVDVKKMVLNFSGNIFYRYKRIKYGFGIGLFHYMESNDNSFFKDYYPYLSAQFGYNFMPRKIYKRFFLGPVAEFCLNANSGLGLDDARTIIGLGLDFHYKNIHFTSKYKWSQYYPNFYYERGRELFFSIGYSFKLAKAKWN
jgi:hypothetical protein